MSAYVRHKIGEERRSLPGRFAALTDDHPMIGSRCINCMEPLRIGDVPTLYAVGPDDPDEGGKADELRWYTAYALPMHQECAWPREQS